MKWPTTPQTTADTGGRTTLTPHVAEMTATRTFLRAPGLAVSITYVDRDHAVVLLGPAPARGGSTTAARLVCEAMSQARARGVRDVRLALELAQPVSGVVLSALRARIDTDLSTLELHRAGSSVILTATLLQREGCVAVG